MYKSPIEKIYGEIQAQMAQENENMVMKAIRKVGVNVNKEALIKALQYDRNQYTKGYEDGKNEVLNEIRAEIEQAADKQFQIAMGVADLNERYTHIQMENAYRHSLNIIDKYKAESEE